jgi:predicted Zn finger-like uncharacterized protein
MILTCPECATRYFVGDDQVGASGRTVKCKACGHRWTARAEPVLDLELSDEEGATAREPSTLTPEPTPLVELPGEELPKAFRAKAQTERRVREAATTGIVWAAMTGMLVVIGAGAYFGRETVVSIWPRTASVYAAVNAPVNRVGLEIEDIRAEPALQDGHAALSVSGVIRNVRAETVTAPPLQISLLNDKDKRVMAKIASAADPKIPAGETRHFAVVLVDPPRTAATVEVGFVLDKGAVAQKPKKTAAPKAEAEVKGPSLRGSKSAEPAEATGTGHVEEAKPLGAHDPNALPAAAEAEAGH